MRAAAVIVGSALTLSLAAWGAVQGEEQRIEEGKLISPGALSDAELAKALGSKDAAVSSAAAAEVVRRGERMIPLLFELKGDVRRFSGSLGGRSATAYYWEYEGDSVVPVSREIEYHVVSVEVAALYLIPAIYLQDLYFAEVPFLTEKSTGISSNLPEFVGDAWQSVIGWDEQRKRQGLDALRDSKTAPLSNARCEFR